MSTELPVVIDDTNLSFAWARAYLLVIDSPKHSVPPMVVSTSGFSGDEPIESPEVRIVLEETLAAAGMQTIDATASTLFPFKPWNHLGRPGIDTFSAWYLKKYFPRLQALDGLNRYGTYFERMVRYRGLKGRDKSEKAVDLNQLQELIRIWRHAGEKGKRPRQSALQLACFDPPKDLTGQAMRGFPCLAQISVSYDNRGGLSLTGFYPSQYLFDRAYGNYLGLSHLGAFLASQLELQLVRVTCIANHPELGNTSKASLSKLTETVRCALASSLSSRSSASLSAKPRRRENLPVVPPPAASRATLESAENGGLEVGIASAGASVDASFPIPQVSPAKSITVFSKLSPAKPTPVYDTYWYLACERQEVFFRRLEGQTPPWTSDAILREYKFTNAYRASDRVSQYLIRRVIYSGSSRPEDIFLRVLLFKIFNRIETWEHLESTLGNVKASTFDYALFDHTLCDLATTTPIYSAAYIMPTGTGELRSDRKHRMHLKLLELMLEDGLPHRIGEASSLRKAFELLRSYPSIGDFLALQFVTDLNYSSILDFSENDFVVPGPGARSGIRKCFSDLGGLNETEIIHLVTERQEHEFQQRGLTFRSLWGRPLQLIDCQNLFCEVDKYARVAYPQFSGVGGRTRIKQKYQSSGELLPPWYPPKWGLNELIQTGGSHVPSVPGRDGR